MLYRLIYVALNVYAFGLIAYSLLSWVQDRKLDQARRWLGQFYEPVLTPLRSVIKPVKVGSGGGQLDLAPLALLVAIFIAQRLARYIILGY